MLSPKEIVLPVKTFYLKSNIKIYLFIEPYSICLIQRPSFYLDCVSFVDFAFTHTIRQTQFHAGKKETAVTIQNAASTVTAECNLIQWRTM